MSANESRPRRQQEGGSHGHGDDQGQRNAPRRPSTPERVEFVASPAGQAFERAASSRTAVVHVTFSHLAHVAEAARLAGAGPAEQRRALDAAYHRLIEIADQALIEAVEQIQGGE